MSTSSIKANQKLTAQQKAAKEQQKQGEGPKKKTHRYGPGTQALMKIRKYQKSVEFLIKKLPFQRLVQEVAQGISLDLRFTADTIFCITRSHQSLFGKPHGRWEPLYHPPSHQNISIWFRI